ncbi:MAG: nitrate/sulfonate/bicarbonate ABC transporter ATP-binding protein [Anaerolineae bacterium]|nr:nitrate/sulfonate/bicarbonate ABC transporter ATP-binding protein [Anaerolineae bacterium]
MQKAAPTATRPVLLQATKVCKAFDLPDGKGIFTVLQDINLTIYEGEFVALLGKSGSGKSTLLRILAGLIPPSSGLVVSSGKPVEGPNPDVAMVFQSFALLPWLTVQENVELGLKAQGVPREERRRRALQAIDRVGLDGFESAYPKELSGGMKQRVGLARAFVMQPSLLFMDEPFSGLDVLTAENLRSEVADLWAAGNFPARSVLLVTHNIDDAVLLADRVLILGANPGRVRGEVRIDLPRPRERTMPGYEQIKDAIYLAMTNPEADVQQLVAGIDRRMEKRFPPLPHARIGGVSGLLELVDERGGAYEVAELAGELHIDADDLWHFLDAARLLGFAEVHNGRVSLTPAGHAFVEADILESKELFRRQALERVPLVRFIANTLKGSKRAEMDAEFFLDVLDEHFPADEAQRQLETAVEWGRYAELFEYDADRNRLRLPEESLADAPA